MILKLEGQQRIPHDGSVQLGLFTPDEATSVNGSFTLAADRSLSLELGDDSRPVTRSSDAPATAVSWFVVAP